MKLLLVGPGFLFAAAAIAGEAMSENAPVTVAETKPRLTISGWIETSFTANFDQPNDNQNFGRLFDDRSNEPLLNQIALTAERALDSTAARFDWGFKMQFLFGSDARYIHSLGLFDDTMKSSLDQPDVVEAYLNLHFPILTAGGLDLKLGKFVSLEGVETIDPRSDIFFSHSYIFNFGTPLNHTGVLLTLHTTAWLDLIAGLTRGVNTSLEDNNDSLAFEGGFSLNLDGGKFVLGAATHIGPETPNDNHNLRYLSDVSFTWKMSDRFSAITDTNYAYDQAAGAVGYGLAQYLTYAFNDNVRVKIRGEIWRDDQGFYVAQFADPHDPVRALEGVPTIDPRTVGGGRTTYGALTLGVDLKLPVPKPLTGLTIRPEARVDHSLNGTRPFNDSRDQTMFTVGLDAIFTF